MCDTTGPAANAEDVEIRLQVREKVGSVVFCGAVLFVQCCHVRIVADHEFVLIGHCYRINIEVFSCDSI